MQSRGGAVPRGRPQGARRAGGGEEATGTWRALPILALACALLLAAPAQAHHAGTGPVSGSTGGAEVTDPLLGEYLSAARDYWQADPGCGDPVERFHFVYYTLDETANARAYRCGGWLNDRFWGPVPRSEIACVIVAHELGHAMGLDHTDDPNTVMFAGDPVRRWNVEALSPPAPGSPRSRRCREPRSPCRPSIGTPRRPPTRSAAEDCGLEPTWPPGALSDGGWSVVIDAIADGDDLHSAAGGAAGTRAPRG